MLSGVRPVAGERSPIMPGFAASMDDGQIAATHSVSAGLDYASVGPEHAYGHNRPDQRERLCARA